MYSMGVGRCRRVISFSCLLLSLRSRSQSYRLHDKWALYARDVRYVYRVLSSAPTPSYVHAPCKKWILDPLLLNRYLRVRSSTFMFYTPAFDTTFTRPHDKRRDVLREKYRVFGVCEVEAVMVVVVVLVI